MKLNPQAVISAGAIGGYGAGGGIQIGTNVPSGIKNNHRFTTTEERDRYFTANLHELDRLKTIIVCGSDLQLWTGTSTPTAYDNTKWANMTWVIQGEQGLAGEKGDAGRGVAGIQASVSADDTRWMLTVSYTDGSQEILTFPIPNSIVDIGTRLNALETRWSAQGQQPVADLNTLVHQGRYQVSGDVTLNKPPLLASRGSVDVHIVGGGDIIQVVNSIDGGIYSRVRQGGRWGNWITASNIGGGLNSEHELILTSLANRLPEVSIAAVDMNGLVKQGRFCFNDQTANRPTNSTHGSVDVHVCKDHVLQVATTVDAVLYHRRMDTASSTWTEWTTISDQTGGATMHAFPRASCVYTTADHLVPAHHGGGFYYIPWRYVLHDNYGCTAQSTVEKHQSWWVCPKGGSYDMKLYVAISYVKTPQTLPAMLVVQAWHRRADGSETKLAQYDMPTDTANVDQKTKSAKLRIENLPAGDMIRWRVSFAGASWSTADNPDVSFAPFRTMLMVDEADHDTAERIGELAYKTWANFHTKQGFSIVVEEERDTARLNAVKWNPTVEPVQPVTGALDDINAP